MRDKHILTESQLAGMMHSVGIRPSIQRIAVLNLVANTDRHPTADEIFSELSKSYPTLSKTTVYNSLHAMVDTGLVKELEIESGNKHYDLAPQPPHSHFICRGCGKIFDMAIPAGLEGISSEGFSVDSVDVYLKGLCPDCVKTQQSQ